MDQDSFRKPPPLTVVLPTHKGERWLSRTLESLVAQSYREFHCVLIDSSPTLDTVSIAEGFADQLSLRIEHRPDIQDWQGKTNLAVELAQTPYISMLHQDDLWESDRAAIAKGWIENQPDVTLHLHPCWIVDEHDKRLGLWRCPLPAETAISKTLFHDRLIVQNFIAVCAPIIRRDAFLAVSGLDRSLWYTADWDLYLKLGRAGPVAYHRQTLAGYRIHADALTVSGSKRAEDFEHQLNTVLDRHLDAAGPGYRTSVGARARAAVAVNVALAGALHQRGAGLFGAVTKVLLLGPFGIVAFLRDTRLIERVVPRLRLHRRGRLAPTKKSP